MDNYTGVKIMIKKTAVGKSVGILTEEFKVVSNRSYIFQFKIIPNTNHTSLDNIYISIGGSLIRCDNILLEQGQVINNIDGKKEYLCYGSFRTEGLSGKAKLHVGRFQNGIDRDNTIAFYIREIQVEKGVNKNGWRPSSDDYGDAIKKIQSQIEILNNKIELSSAMQDIDDINGTIKNLESKIILLTNKISLSATSQDIHSANGRVETTNARIDVESDKINLKVSRDSVISSINMSPEAIQINASQIDMSGNLDLNGTFKCYRNGSNKTGHYLYQNGAMQRGYLEGRPNPTFSSGVWMPDGINEMGYVSVGWTNSDHIDENGCLWISPLAGGGGQLIYSRLLSDGIGSVSGITYHKSGLVEYHSALDNKESVGVISHRFDGGLSAYTGFFNNIYADGSLKVNATVYTDNQSLFITSGGYNNPYYLQLISNGYLLPGGNVQLGQTDRPFYQLVCTHAPAIVSDERRKTNIKYIDNPIMTLPIYNDDDSEVITKDDMYLFIRDDLKLATYELLDNKEDDIGKTDIGFIAQDILETKIGKYIVDSKDPNNLVYDMANRISVLEGALQKSIGKIEELENVLINVMR